MKKNDFTKINLAKGAILLYDFKKARLHAYQTNDPTNDYILLVEKAGIGVVIETPCFHDNRMEFENYIAANSIDVLAVLSSYHITGREFLAGVRRYATPNVSAYRAGHGGAIIEQFAAMHGPKFDKSIIEITDYIDGDSLNIAGIKMNIIQTDEAFDIEIPEIKAMYIHMLGHDEHSFMPMAAAADAEIKKLSGIARKKYDLILTSHHAPEDSKDVRAKIKYLTDLAAEMRVHTSADTFKTAMRGKYPSLGGGKFLDMTASAIQR